jgi:hypothetical protein
MCCMQMQRQRLRWRSQQVAISTGGSGRRDLDMQSRRGPRNLGKVHIGAGCNLGKGEGDFGEGDGKFGQGEGDFREGDGKFGEGGAGTSN